MSDTGTAAPAAGPVVFAQGFLLVLAGAVSAVVLAEAIARLGILVAAAPVALAGAALLVNRPGTTLGLLAGAVVAAEEGDEGFLTVTAHWYDSLVANLQVTDVLLIILVVGVVTDGVRRGTGFPRLGALAYPLGLLAAAAVAGAVTGWTDPAHNAVALFDSLRVLAYLVVLPFATAHVLARDPERRLRLAVGAAAGIVTAKAALGLGGWLAGQGRAFGESQLVYYEPAMNFLLTAFLLAIAVAWITRVRLPRWVNLAVPVALAALVLSYRRSFWIAAALGLGMVVVVATGRRGRPWVVAMGVLLAVAAWLSIVGGGATSSTNPVVERARSLSPTELVGNTDDRYRLEEQQNVIEEIRRQPLTGLGLGVPWSAHHPLSLEREGGRLYTHVTPLWFWLKLGPLGVVAYCWLTVAVVATALAVWRRQADPVLRIAGLAVAGAWLGLVVAELTGGFTGINRRITVVEGVIIGWLAVAAVRRQSSTDRYTATVPETIASTG